MVDGRGCIGHTNIYAHSHHRTRTIEHLALRSKPEGMPTSAEARFVGSPMCIVSGFLRFVVMCVVSTSRWCCFCRVSLLVTVIYKTSTKMCIYKIINEELA